jgi:2-hydroxychromene-2-carboxylate isomerase
MSQEQMAKFFGCTVEKLKVQYALNAAYTAKMLAKSLHTGKKVNGFTSAQLEIMLAKDNKLAGL